LLSFTDFKRVLLNNFANRIKQLAHIVQNIGMLKST
jgi:hypothetical protein